MLRIVLILGSLTLAGVVAHAQAPQAPLQLVPGAVAAAVNAEVPTNWNIVDGERDPLTEKTSRMAITLPKSDSAMRQAAGLGLICLSSSPNGPTHPEVALVFTSLAGLSRYKKFPIRYRFDEGSVSESVVPGKVGANSARRLILPALPDRDPVHAIASAKQLRIEVDLRTRGTVFLDFDVSGAAAAIKAIACR